MKKIVLSLSALALLTTAGVAKEVKNSGVYAGLGYGMSSLGMTRNGKEGFDKESSGFKIYGGYQFNQIVGVEVAYNDFGKFNGKYTTSISESPKDISVSANLGYAFLDGQLRPFATLGLGSMSFTRDGYEVQHEGFLNEYTLNKSSVSFNAGLGLSYKPKMIKGVGFRIAYEYFGTPDVEYSITDSRGATVTDTWKTNVTNTYLGVEYQF